jgi:endonuclease-3
MTPRRHGPDAARVLDRLEAQHPDAWTELHFTNAFELLVATILSAQSTDTRVNEVTPGLFEKYPDAAALANAKAPVLEQDIRTTGFFRMKARSLLGMAQALVAEHKSEVPRDMASLVKLPGVGRKTANVVLGHAMGVPGLPVDRHVLRVTNRIGLVRSDDAERVEAALCARLPPARWVRASDTFILHGRRVCRPKPLCDQCAVRGECEWYREQVSRGQVSGGQVSAQGRGDLSPKVPAAKRAKKPNVR